VRSHNPPVLVVQTQDVRDLFNAEGHPDVRDGKRSAQDVLEDFLQTFDLYMADDGKVGGAAGTGVAPGHLVFTCG
jgi:hypothetical protein